MAEMDYIAVVLAGLYACLCGVGIYLLYSALRTRNKKVNLRNAIVTILTASGILRCLFFVKVAIPTTWDNGFCMALFIIPLWMHCLAISLLICFYATTAYYDSNNSTDTPIILCSVGNLIMLIFDVAIAASFASASDSSREKLLRLIFCISSTMEDLVLAGLLIYFGALFHRLAVDGSGGNVLATWNKKSVSLFETLNWVLTITMLFRASLSIALFMEPQIDGSVNYNGEHPVTAPVVVLFFFGAELLPTLCIFYMLFELDVSPGNKQGGNYKRFRVMGDGRGVETDSALDERLLSVEDASIRVVIEKEEARDAEQLLREQQLRQQQEQQLLWERGPPSPARGIPQSEPPHESNNFGADSRSVFHGHFSPDDGSLVDDLIAQNRDTESSRNIEGGRGSGSIGSSFPQGRSSVHSYLRRTPSPGNLHLQHGSGIKINRQHSPSIYSYSESPNMQVDSFAQISEEAAGAGTGEEGKGEKYSEFVSPRDILLSHKKRSN